MGTRLSAMLPRVRRLLADDSGELVTLAGLGTIWLVSMVSSAILFNGGGATAAYLEREDMKKANETRQAQLKAEMEFLDAKAGAADSDAEREKYEKFKDYKGMELSALYRYSKDEEDRLTNEMAGQVVRGVIKATPAGKLEGWAAVAKGGVALYDIGAIQEEQDRKQRVALGLEPPNKAEAEALIRQARREAALRALNSTIPNRDQKLMGGVADFVTSDLDDEVSLQRDVLSDNTGEGLWLAEVGRLMEQVDPTQKTTAADNTLVIDPDTRAALEGGDKESALVLYKGAQGLEPVIVTRDAETGDLNAKFPVFAGTPSTVFTPDLKQKEKPMAPSWWDGSRPSCPYLYAFDGTRFTAVNDLISVSRDPRREYDDRLLFGAVPRGGTLELRVAEVRGEESFVDALALTAIDLEPGFDAAVTPEGRVLSVAAPRPAERVAGADPSAVAWSDGSGAKAFHGDVIEALWPVAGGPAVLLLSTDGFETDGAEGAPTGQRPAIAVEVRRGGAWRRVSVVYPKEQADTMAVDLSGMAESGTLRVRLVVSSCHERRYQLVDRVALSTARTDAASVRAVPLASAQVDGRDVRAALASADGDRMHTVPGDVLYLACPDPGADRYLITTRGWYRAYAP